MVRQSDGSHTGFEVTDSTPYRTLATTPHFEKQFAACLPHTLPISPSVSPPVVNTRGAGSQLEVAVAVGPANYFDAHISADQTTIYFDVFDSQHVLVSEKAFTSSATLPGFPLFDAGNDVFQSLALADLNQDGTLDLIAVFDVRLMSSSSGGVWTFLGNGDGTFQPGNRQVLTGYEQLLTAVSATIGDLNGDGKPDLVLAGLSSPITIALGNGDGTFNPQTLPLAVSTVQSPMSVALADLNADGKLDLVVAPWTTAQGNSAIAVALLIMTTPLKRAQTNIHPIVSLVKRIIAGSNGSVRVGFHVIVPAALPQAALAGAETACKIQDSNRAAAHGNHVPNAKSLVAKRLCLHCQRGYSAGGFSEQGRQASITVDIGRFRVCATLRQLFPSART